MSIDLPSFASAAILEPLMDGVIITGIDGHVKFANESACRICGVAEPGMSGFPFDSLVQLLPLDNDELAAVPIPLTRPGAETVEAAIWRIRRRDGTEVIVQGSARPLPINAGSVQGAVLVLRDVTRTYTLEQALQQSEGRYRLLTNSLPHIVWTCRPDGSCDYFNEYTAIYTGVPVAKCLEWGWKAIIHPDDLELTTARWMHSVQTGENYEAEFRLITSDGSYRWNLDRGTPVRNERGEIIGWIGTATDIDDRRHAEANIEASRELYRALAEAVPQIVYSSYPDGSPDYLNSHWYRYTGAKPGDNTYATWHATLHPDDHERATHAWSQSLETGEPFEVEYRLKGADGKYRWFLARGVPQRDGRGNIVRWFGTATDIDGPKREEEHSGRLAAIVESSLDAIVSTDLNGIVTSWNGAAERIYGYTAEEMVGNSKSLIVPPDRATEMDSILDRVRGGERIDHFDTVRLCKNGSLAHVSVSVSAVLDARRNPIGASTIARDISERIRGEKERDRHMAEIQALYEQLQRAMRETHHRVRNSLQIVAALVEMEAPGPGETVGGEEFKRIGGHLRALAAVHDLLTEQAKRDSIVMDISARDILQTLVDLVRRTAGDNRVVVDIDEVRLPTQQGTSLAVVAHELITNALKYGQGFIEVRLLVRDGTATLEVNDNGPGFGEQFNPEESGNIGLELVSQVARWDLRAQSVCFDTRPGGGGRVRILIPLPAADSPLVPAR